MADKRIQDLTPASQVQTSDRFVLEQSGQAKSLTGQILINDLAAFLDGHGGIADISYTPPSSGSLTGTLTVTLADETVESFSVMNGRGITSLTKTGTSGLEDTYTITYNDGSTPTTFTVTNGKGIVGVSYVESVGLNDYYEITYNDDSEPDTFVVHNGEKGDTGDNWYVHIKWAAVMPTQDSDMVNYPSDFIGIYAGVSATAPTSFTAYQWYDYKGEKGDTGTSITGVSWVSSSGLIDTYRVSFSDGNSTTFNVTNGSQINSITKTSTSGLVDTYTVQLTNGNQTTFQVNNGKSIVSVTWTSTTSPTGVPHVPGATDTYTVAYNDGDSTTFQVYNGLDGEGASLTVDGIPSVNGNVPLLTIDMEHGAPTPQTVGSPKSRYFDAINSVLYICLGYDENNGYLWRGAGVTVDVALSTSSTNPVQNRVITNKIGTAALDTTAQNLSGAVNEILDDISGFADNLAAEYDPTATYAVGDLCIYNTVLYRCNTAISTPEAWNSIHWTATSIDEELDTLSGVVNGKADQSDLDDLEDEVETIPRPNLLDNWYFVGGGSQLGDGVFPINSRGKTSYSANGYTIDRWYNENSQLVNIDSDDVYFKCPDDRVSSQLYQLIADYNLIDGQTYTVSVLLKNIGGTGRIVVSGKVSPWPSFAQLEFTTPGLHSLTFTYNKDSYSGNVAFILNARDGASLWVKAVKLEVGSVQTLAHQENGNWVLNEIPNYEEQLLRCGTDAYRVIHPNMLDNWYFVGGGSQQGGGQFPINQRGQTSYSSSGYTIDRWLSEGMSVAVGSSSITITNNTEWSIWFTSIQQNVPQNITLTGSVIVTAYSGTILFVMQQRSGSQNVFSTAVSKTGLLTGSGQATTSNQYNFGFYMTSGSSITITACKLELGTAQTLAHQENGVWVLNEIPNYSEELAKCQRYYRKILALYYNVLGRTDTSSLYLSFPFEMARTPSAISSIGLYFANVTTVEISGTLTFVQDSNRLLRAYMPKGSLSGNQGGTVVFTSDLTISADL